LAGVLATWVLPIKARKCSTVDRKMLRACQRPNSARQADYNLLWPAALRWRGSGSGGGEHLQVVALVLSRA